MSEALAAALQAVSTGIDGWLNTGMGKHIGISIICSSILMSDGPAKRRWRTALNAHYPRGLRQGKVQPFRFRALDRRTAGRDVRRTYIACRMTQI